MIIVLKFSVFALGLLVVLGTIASAIQTFVLPRGAADLITGIVFRFIRWCFDLLIKRTKNYTARDHFMALYAPVRVLVLLPVWLILVSLGYAAMFWASGIDNFLDVFTISGSSLKPSVLRKEIPPSKRYWLSQKPLLDSFCLRC